MYIDYNTVSFNSVDLLYSLAALGTFIWGLYSLGVMGTEVR